MKKIRLTVLMLAISPALSAAQDGAVKDSAPKSDKQVDSWTGKLEMKDSGAVELVATGERYELRGPIIKYLEKDNGKDRKVSGRLVEGNTIDVTKVEPAPRLR